MKKPVYPAVSLPRGRVCFFSRLRIQWHRGERMKERLERLLCVKSIVTVLLTVFFCILSARGSVSAQEFITIFTVVISFYFGTQHERRE